MHSYSVVPKDRLGVKPEDVVLYGQSVGSGPTVSTVVACWW